jgi:hypothetical protein
MEFMQHHFCYIGKYIIYPRICNTGYSLILRYMYSVISKKVHMLTSFSLEMLLVKCTGQYFFFQAAHCSFKILSNPVYFNLFLDNKRH